LGLSSRASDPNERTPARSGKRASRFVPGEVVAERYRLIRELGEGGMGVVWVAHSLVLGVDVAIKLIRSGMADADLASRMAREAQATASLGHPAIVRVFDFGATAKGDPFLVMELAHGETLASLLRREERLSPIQALQLILPIVDGLRCAHERGIVHRDIKPENVFVARDALGRVQPKLLDFGIAKLDNHPNVTRLTQVGEVLGSPEFMSPEQARGMGTVDLRTDVWALCVLIYEMLTGTVPFRIQNYNALMQAILHEQPLPTYEYGAGDRELWRILAKGLEKSRNKRWSSMTEIGEALAFWLFDRGISEDVAGNSLKAVWLGGATLNGLSSETGLDVTSPTGVGPLGSPTLKLRVRRMKSRLFRAMTPPVRVVAGALALGLVVVLVMLFAGRRPREAPAPEPTAGPTRAAQGPVAPRPGPDPTPVVSAESLALAPAAPLASNKRKSKSPVRALPSRTPTTRRAGQGSPSKSIRDFGF
jgi:serine/threonine-protein kinase